MFKYIESIIKEKSKDVVFTKLKEGKSVEIANFKIDSSFSIPMLTIDVVNKVKGEEEYDINVSSMVDGMIKTIGIDPEFKYLDIYSKFLLNFDKQIGSKILNNGLFYASNEQFIDALIHLRAAYVILGDDLNVIYNYAKICDQLSEKHISNKKKSQAFLNEANLVFKYIIEKYPEFSDAYYHLGFHYGLENNYVKAKEYFRIAMNLGIDDEKKMKIIDVIKDIDDKADFELGSKYIIDERFQEGLEKLLPLEEYHSDWWNLLFFIGLAYRRLNEVEKAIDYFKRTLEYNSAHTETMNELGIAYLTIGNIKNAKKIYKEAIKLKPNDHELLCNMGIVYLNDSDIEKAEEYLKKAKEIKPEDEIVNSWLNKLKSLKK